MYRIVRVLGLSRAERRRLRRWITRMVDYGANIGPERGGFGVYSFWGDPDTVTEANSLARQAMLVIGRTFDYEVSK